MEPPVPVTQTAPNINRWMNVTEKQLVHGADPGGEILRSNLLGPDKATTANNVESALTATSRQLEQKLAEGTRSGLTINAEQHLQDAIAEAGKTIGRSSDPAFVKRLEGLAEEIHNRYGDMSSLTPEEAHKIKVALGDAIKWNGAPYEGDINKVLLKVYRGINADIKGSIEGIGDVQQKWGNLYQARQSLKSSLRKDAIGRGTGSAIPIPKPPR